MAGVLVVTGCVAAPLPSPSPVRSAERASPAAVSPSPAPGPPGEPTWARAADIPTPRSEVAAAIFRDAIYVVGGFGGPNVVERYLPASNAWQRAPDLPIAVDHPMAAAIEEGAFAGVYVMGGNSGGTATARTFHLAGGSSAWRELAPMPAPRSAGAAVTHQHFAGSDAPFTPPRIYVVGGASGGRLATATLEYDPATDRWSSRAPIPTPRDHLAAAWLGGVCAVGGRELSMSRNLAALECYDPATDSWRRLPAAPTPRGGVGAAVVDGTLFLIGGEQPSGTFGDVEAFDIRTERWSRAPDLPTPRHGTGVAAYGGKVYVMSGGPAPGGSQTPVCEVLTVRE